MVIHSMFWALCLCSSAIVVSVISRTRERWKQECRPCSFPRRTHPADHMLTLRLTPELRWATWSTHHLWHYRSEGCVHSWCVLQTEEMRSLWGHTGPGNGHLLIQRSHACTEEARDWGSLKYYFPVAPWYWKAVSGLGILISHYVN